MGLGLGVSWSRRARLWLGLLLLEAEEAMMQRLVWSEVGSAMGWKDGRVVERVSGPSRCCLEWDGVG